MSSGFAREEKYENLYYAVKWQNKEGNYVRNDNNIEMVDINADCEVF